MEGAAASTYVLCSCSSLAVRSHYVCSFDFVFVDATTIVRARFMTRHRGRDSGFTLVLLLPTLPLNSTLGCVCFGKETWSGGCLLR